MIGGTLFVIAEVMSGGQRSTTFLRNSRCVCFFLGILVSVHSWYLAAAKANGKADFANLRINDLLTDLIDFHFYLTILLPKNLHSTRP